MTNITRFILSAVLTSISLIAGQEPATPIHISTGPAVHSPVPDFKATNQDGRVVTLKSTLGPKGALLVFFRSADW